jgi:RNA polymerase sigma-70 factor (ECF subfamily)
MDLEDIIEGCKKQNPKAQKALYDMFSRKLFGVCLRYCKSREDAQDVFQEAFVKVFNSLDKYRGIGSLESWMRKVFINHSLNHYRYDKFLNSVCADDINIAYEDKELENMIDEYSNKKILEAIQKLPNKQRIIFNMVEVEEMSYEEVSDVLNISQGCIRAHNFKAKKKLKTLLKEFDKQ